MNFKNKIRHCEKLQMRQKSLMRSCKHTNTITRGKQHCNVSKANIGLLEHVQCTCMSDKPKMSIPKFKYKLQTCKIKSSKVKTVLCCVQKGTFMAMLNRDAQKQIFTNLYEF